ncbi:MAG: hypothetical protein J5608_02300 [Alphaproteobacteria bacterium]|nr:hypothetical protein [Alphaproteobacteria bacterium]
MKKLKQIFCGLFIAIFAIAPVAATQNTSRTAINTERARAVGTAPSVSVRAKQPVVAQRGTSTTTSSRAKSNVVQRNNAASTRTAVVTQKRVTRSPSRVSRAAHILSDAGDIIIRRALGIGRTASTKQISRAATGGNHARSALPKGLARATAVFSDISKMGEGYTRCRESYNTCMDQFCAGMNETYRRCYCSDNFRNLRDKEDAMDAATTMLAKFEDNNLNAVSLSADEVNAMYSATAGESAIKKDTSGAAALLDEIGDLLSGKKKASQTGMMSLTGLSIDFSSDLGDIWGGSGADSLFSTSSADLSRMEGVELYNNAHNQCLQMVGASCDNTAVKTMVKSAYGVLITQDCNAYQKNLDAKTEKVKQTVRQAEKMLREARLDEYRAHNSADVNECMDKVEKALLAPTACGANYEKCMDYTGIYINATTGDPIYSERLFGLIDIINLNGKTADVLAQNKEFDRFLDSKRMFASSALDTCRTIADTVWTEFKRNALIKISQAQDEKIEEVKMSCVSTMKECYDTQSDALKSFDDTTAQTSGALAARASRDLCSDKVLACAALYAKEGSERCKLDSKGKVSNAPTCGLKSLLAFVDNVDDTRIAEGCSTAVDSYLKELCTPSSGDKGYPWNCRLKQFDNGAVDVYNMIVDTNNINTLSKQRSALPRSARPAINTSTFNNVSIANNVASVSNITAAREIPGVNSIAHVSDSPNSTNNAGDRAQITYKRGDSSNLVQMVMNYAFENCGVEEGNTRKLEMRSINEVAVKLQNIQADMSDLLSAACAEVDGIWVDPDYNNNAGGLSRGIGLDSFYNNVYGMPYKNANEKYGADRWGKCVKNDLMTRCMLEDELSGGNGWVQYENGTCVFSTEYYKYQCEHVRGVWSDNHCYVQSGD